MSNLRDLLLDIREERGRLTPQIVVDEARAESHPLHNRFEWDDSVAGEAYRRMQAGELIRSVRISFLPREGGPASIRAFHAVSTPAIGNVYSPVEEIVENPIARSALLRDMERDWRALRARYDHFVEFWSLISDDLADTA